jgi:hypothetical protein
MPCTDYINTLEDRNREADQYKHRCDYLANLLCQVGKCCLSKTPFPEEVIAWWDAHAKEDELRGEPWEEKRIIIKP